MPWFLLPASLWCDLGSLGPDKGNEVLVDEEDKSQAGDLGRKDGSVQRWNRTSMDYIVMYQVTHPGMLCPQLTSTTELLLSLHLEPHSTGRPSI